MHVGSAISGNSSFNNIVAFAGGRGSAYGYWVADNGGSGGGSGCGAIIPGTGTVGQGYDGGIGDEGPECIAGGGGGATTHIGLSAFPAGGTGIVIIRYLT